MKYQIQTSKFKNVKRSYPQGIIKGIKEISYGQCFLPAPNILNLASNDFNQVLQHLESMKAKTVQLIIEDQYGEIRYPDYKLKELI